MDISIKEVRFDKYCKRCKSANVLGSDEPCNTCMNSPARYGTEVPVKYKEKIRKKIKSYNDTEDSALLKGGKKYGRQ